jgi:hypothetical protein
MLSIEEKVLRGQITLRPLPINAQSKLSGHLTKNDRQNPVNCMHNDTQACMRSRRACKVIEL